MVQEGLQGVQHLERVSQDVRDYVIGLQGCKHVVQTGRILSKLLDTKLAGDLHVEKMVRKPIRGSARVRADEL